MISRSLSLSKPFRCPEGILPVVSVYKCQVLCVPLCFLSLNNIIIMQVLHTCLHTFVMVEVRRISSLTVKAIVFGDHHVSSHDLLV